MVESLGARIAAWEPTIRAVHRVKACEELPQYTGVKTKYLNLYLVERDGTGYDEYLGHVIAAGSKEEAVELAAKSAASEGRSGWSNPRCRMLGVTTYSCEDAHIVMSSFHAG